MAMNKDALGAAMWAAVKTTQTFNPAPTPAQEAMGLAVWTVIADEIIKHVIANATVKVDTFAVNVSGITAGGASTSAVSGNATGKVTS